MSIGPWTTLVGVEELAAAMGDPAFAGRRAGFPRAGAFLRVADGRFDVGLSREPAFDLVVLAPERAAVLLAMPASLVAATSSAPSATLVTRPR